jgi:hypothetical protein
LRGIDGLDGTPGAAGRKGAIGDKGFKGPSGDPGKPGDNVIHEQLHLQFEKFFLFYFYIRSRLYMQEPLKMFND